MNRDSCQMKRVDRNWSTWDAETRPKIGEFWIFTDREWPAIEGSVMMTMVLPSGNLCTIPVKIGEKVEHAWQWDGNLDAPTLHPSVDHGHRGPDGQLISEWHGWIRAGRMESC